MHCHHAEYVALYPYVDSQAAKVKLLSVFEGRYIAPRLYVDTLPPACM